VLCLREEIWERAFVELCLSDDAALEELLSGAVEGSVEEGEESESLLGENLAIEVVDLACDVHAMKN